MTAKDANGKTVLPITYNGTTYLPVRAVGTLLGTEINYDGATSSVLIGGTNGSAPVTSGKVTLSALGTSVLGSTAWHTKDPADTTYKGKDYKDVYLHDDPSKQGMTSRLIREKYSSALGTCRTERKSGDSYLRSGSRDTQKFNITPDDGMMSLDVDVKVQMLSMSRLYLKIRVQPCLYHLQHHI